MSSFFLASLVFVVVFGTWIIIGIRIRNKATVSGGHDETKGEEGERNMAELLSELPKDKYFVFNDLLVYQNGRTAQIDHVVVSQFGIFVIETKNYHGRIYGGNDVKYWSQNLHGHQYKFYNPIFQNRGHVKALSQLLDLEERYFVSIVAFSFNAEFRFQPADNVMYMRHVNTSIQTCTQMVFSEDKVQQICQWLSFLNIESKKARQQHVQNVKAIKKGKLFD